MNKVTWVLLVLIVLAGGVIFIAATQTAKPQEALNNCYVEGTRNLDQYKTTNDLQSCLSSMREIETIAQCRNNVYGQYGKTLTYLAKKKLFLTKSDPYTTLVTEHNEICAAHTDTIIKN